MMRFEAMLRRVPLGQRAFLALIVVVVPMSILLAFTVTLLQREDGAMQQIIDESVDILVPLSTLEYQLQRALNDELMAQTAQTVPGFSDLTHAIDRTFSSLAAYGSTLDFPVESIDTARTAWHQARPGVARLIEEVGVMNLAGVAPEDAVTRSELEMAVQTIENVKQQMAHAIKVRYLHILSQQRQQLHMLLWSWSIALLFSALVIAALVYSVLKPVRALGQAVQRTAQGADNVHIDVRGCDELSAVGAYFNDMVESLRTSQSMLEAKAYRDELTNLPNRRGILGLLSDALTAAVQTSTPVSVLMIDVDKFKAINDRFGHAAGDEALIWLAAEMRNILRKSDLLGRYAGDEFLAVLPNAAHDKALEVAERLCVQIHNRGTNNDRRPAISIGVATSVAGSSEIASLLEEADQALYQAKGRGRGQVVAASPLIAVKV